MNNELEIIDGNNDFLKVKDTKKEKRRKGGIYKSNC